ncbi:MucR family transcriptional regulator [Roseibium aggregatum]|uniref:MucR family transcriptional regulator n=1 Tax=Roseibium aggregatum TaxID=187304 RepID=A0A926P3M2_9HYPH|nr:MucR family transcriptional regulator [Roseibium aggregatum]MBD1549676.1 MucR family transcriptional regulator [Roseibium aggregatum]
MTENSDATNLIYLTADIVSAYVANNTIASAELPNLIQKIHGSLLKTTAEAAGPEPQPLKPAVPIKKSVTPDFIICLEDGKQFKSLKRHLRSQYGMTQEEYRKKWGLDQDYPMVAPNYAASRSALAKKMGLGQKSKGRKRK